MIVLGIILFVLFSYTVGPTVLIRRYGLGIHKQGKGENKVALTFDDGPDPVYTPLLLELLDKYHAKATFFVVGEKARAYPDIIKEIDERGHTIGLHNDVHISNWLLPPFLFKKQLKRAQQTIYEITGVCPVFYRPPWGHFNLFSLQAAKPLQTVIWTSIPGDWKEKVGSKELAKRLKDACRSGAIITLHDSGTTLGADLHAPANTIAALELFLSEQTATEIQFVTVPDILQQTDQSED
ncbi:polysaccharide deacetylase family protein [Bacillus xiapuensis]|uniref:polysaccharide deacetylase family protein n=1 Tax=Bacillus xiapuensis TaxID=2014075 RepID=UPI001E4F33F1|nr:polysaccharide deacetylase family protein [Bacillus xiapuensis]